MFCWTRRPHCFCTILFWSSCNGISYVIFYAIYIKIVYQVGINKGIILRCTAYQISRPELVCWFFFGATALQWAMASSCTRILDHTQRRITVGRTPLDEWSARRRDLYLTTHNTQQKTDIHATGEIRTHSLSKGVTADVRLSPRGHWDRPCKWCSM